MDQQQDKYSAVWVSHSSTTDFLSCPRLYFLKNIYKDPKTNHKIQIMSPSLALGQAVHRVVESLSTISVENRFKDSLFDKFDKEWKKITGVKGGFRSKATEESFKERGLSMLKRIVKNPGPLNNLAVKIKDELPNYWISKEDNIILCGKIDWLEYLPDTNSVHIIDFKTSKNREKDDSLQLPIYHLLAANCQKRKVSKASYWYLELSDTLEKKTLPDIDESKDTVLKVAKKMKVVRQLEKYDCKNGKSGCRHCRPFEMIINNEAELVGMDGRRDLYVLKDYSLENEVESYLI